MNPIVKVLIAASLFCLVLYYGIAGFIGSTTELSDSLDVKSLAHIRPESKSSDKKVELIKLDDADVNKPSPRRGDTAIEERVTAPEQVPSGLAKTVEDAQETSGALAAESAERLKQALGIVEPEPAVKAVDVAFEIPQNCDVSDIVQAALPVQYRHESPTIKGASINELQLLVAAYKECEGGVFRFEHNPLGKEDATPMLMQRRLDELKYFFLQHRVPKAAMRFPDNP